MMLTDFSVHDIGEVKLQVNDFPDCAFPFTSLRIDIDHKSVIARSSLTFFFKTPEEILLFGQKVKECCDTLKPRETEVKTCQKEGDTAVQGDMVEPAESGEREESVVPELTRGSEQLPSTEQGRPDASPRSESEKPQE